MQKYPDKAIRRRRAKKINGPFIPLTKNMLFKCLEWRGLTSNEKVAYLYLRAKYNGRNNGEIRMHYSEFKGLCGFSSDRSISCAIQGLEKKGWITRTKRGGLYRYFNEFGLTGKFDKTV